MKDDEAGVAGDDAVDADRAAAKYMFVAADELPSDLDTTAEQSMIDSPVPTKSSDKRKSAAAGK